MWNKDPRRRRVFTVAEYLSDGHSRAELRWAEHRGAVTRVVRGVYADGNREPDDFEIALAHMLRDGVPLWGLVSARFHGLDAVDDVAPPEPRRHRVPRLGAEPLARFGVVCDSALQTMVDLAVQLDDLRWEQANESALHRKLFTLDEELAMLDELSRRRHPGTARIRRVLALRPPGAPPTESRLETMGVQIARVAEGVPEPTRQRVVENEHGEFVARVDLSWPELGAFWELDGQGHRGQPVYDSSRESAVVAATGWLCSRMTWREARNSAWAARRISQVIAQARRRPLAS